MNELKHTFKKLTHEQQAIVMDGRIQGQHSPDEWLALLMPVADFDQQSDALRVSKAGYFERRFARKHDVPNGLRTFTLPLLPILREDQDPAVPLELRLDLTGAEQKEKEVRTSDPYTAGRYRKIVDTFYDDPWLEGHARFADGADVRFAVIDHVRSSKKTKRSASGKIKTKTKNKKKTEVSVSISFPKRNYETAGEPAKTAGLRKESVTPGDDTTVVKLNRVVVADYYSTPEPELLLQLLGDAYDRVDPSRRKKL